MKIQNLDSKYYFHIFILNDLFESAMLDENLLDKQLVLESMIDLLEKSLGVNPHQQSSQLLQQRSSSHLNAQQGLSSGGASSLLFEMSSIKLLLTLSKFKLLTF